MYVESNFEFFSMSKLMQHIFIHLTLSCVLVADVFLSYCSCLWDLLLLHVNTCPLDSLNSCEKLFNEPTDDI